MNIVYLEDNEADRFLIQTIIKNINPAHNLFVFPDGPSALNFLNVIKTRMILDLILLDFALPKLNGIEILKIIKSDDSLKNIPVVGFSASVPILEEFMNMGAFGFIEKKFNLDELELEISNILSRIQ